MVKSLIKVSQKHQHIIVKGAGGLRGLTGPQGPQGPQGIQGPQGAQGNSGEMSVGTTTTLPAGSSATVANVGTATKAVLNFGIPKGEKGEAGAGLQITGTVATYADLPSNLTEADAGKAYFVQADGKLYVWTGTAFPADGEGTQFKGDKGDPGATGPANTLTIGTVTSGPTADATITGTAPNQVLNLVMPKDTADGALSPTSENPVQNKVVTAALNTKQDTLEAGDITETLLAADSVSNAKLVNGAISGAANSDTSIDDSDSKIALGAVGTPNLRDSAITTEKIADGAITTAKIGDRQVTSQNVDFTTFGFTWKDGWANDSLTFDSPLAERTVHQVDISSFPVGSVILIESEGSFSFTSASNKSAIDFRFTSDAESVHTPRFFYVGSTATASFYYGFSAKAIIRKTSESQVYVSLIARSVNSAISLAQGFAYTHAVRVA